MLFSVSSVSAADEAIFVNGSSGLDTNDGFSWLTPKLTIQNATETVQNGGTVNIADGTYSGTGNTNITINKTMTIIGQSQTGTIIDGMGSTGIFNISSYVNFFNLTFTNGNFTAGGAILVNGTLSVTNCTFINNNAGDGGAIYGYCIDSGYSYINVTDCTFIGNQASNNGGAIAMFGGFGGNVNCTVSGSTFTNNLVTGGEYFISTGGAISVGTYTQSSTSVCTLINSNFSFNQAPYAGAVFFMGNCTVIGCNFTNNTGSSGGALYYSADQFDDYYCNISHCNFTNNIGGRGGGAITNAGKINLDNCNFTHNTSPGTDTYGGAVCNAEGILTATDCTFTNNQAVNGGAVCNIAGITWYPATSTLTRCSFTGNTATNGGALANYLSSFALGGPGSGVVTSTVSFCNFTGNSATYGGAIFNIADSLTSGSADLNVDNSNFTSNTAGYGGAILSNCFVSAGSVNCNVNLSNFDSNTAQNIGGALYNYSNSGRAVCNIMSSNLVFNTAVYGGALENNVFNGTMNVNFCRIFGNSGEGAAINNYLGSVNATNNWWGNNTDPKTIPNLIAGVAWDNVNSTPWIILSFTVNPDLIGTGEITPAQLNLNFNSNSENIMSTYAKSLPPVWATFTSDSLGSFNPGSGFIIGGTNLESAYTAGSTPGFSTVNATVDQQTLIRTVRIMNRDDLYVATTGDDNTGNGSPLAPFLTISKAVNEVRTNGRIHIANGVYTGLENTQLTINKNMTIMGESQTGTIINGYNTRNMFGVGPDITFYLQDLTFTNGTTTGGWGGAIFNSGRLYVERCTFSYNHADRGGAIYIEDGTLQTYDCLFENNSARNGGGAIYNGFYSSIGSCSFINNTGGTGGAIWNVGAANIFLCSFYLNSATEGTAIYNTYTNEVVRAYNNWWATNDDPKTIINLIAGPARDNVNANPWVLLSVSATPNTIHILETSTISANLSENSNNQHLWDIYNNGILPVMGSFYADGLGTLNPLSNIIPKGQTIYSTFTAGNTPGTVLVGATVQGYTATTPLAITMHTNLTVNNATGNQGETVLLTSVLKDNQGNSLAGKAVEFWVAGVKVGEDVTDATGTATFNYKITQLNGSFPILALFPGDAEYITSNATGELYVPKADLYLKITSDKTNPAVGQIFTLTYKLGNNGPDPAQNVVITINLPAGFTLTNISGDGIWTYNAATRTIAWTLLNVPVGDPYLYISGRLIRAGTYRFGSSISSSTYNINTQGETFLTIKAATVGMQNTGTPLLGILLSILIVATGLILPKTKK